MCFRYLTCQLFLLRLPRVDSVNQSFRIKPDGFKFLIVSLTTRINIYHGEVIPVKGQKWHLIHYSLCLPYFSVGLDGFRFSCSPSSTLTSVEKQNFLPQKLYVSVNLLLELFDNLAHS